MALHKLNGIPPTGGIKDDATRMAIDAIIQILKKETDKARKNENSVFGDPIDLRRGMKREVRDAELQAVEVKQKPFQIEADYPLYTTDESTSEVTKFRVQYAKSDNGSGDGSIRIATVLGHDVGLIYNVEDNFGNRIQASLYEGILSEGETLPNDVIYPIVNHSGTWYFFSVSRFI